METFIIRIYTDPGTARPGRAEHVASGAVRFFHALTEISDALEDLLETAATDATAVLRSNDT